MAQAALFSSYKDPRQNVFAQCSSWLQDVDTYCTGDHTKEWPSRHFASFQALRSKRVVWKKSKDKGIGMHAGLSTGKGELLAENEPPILVEQTQASLRLFPCCARCHKSISSSLKHELEHILHPEGLPTSHGLTDSAAKHIKCEKCDAMFCSLECYDIANCESWHRILCFEAPTPTAWASFQKFAYQTHSQFILAAKIMAEIVVLVKYYGSTLTDACRNYCQFWKRPWLTSGYVDKEIARLKQEKRTKQCSKALDLLIDLLWDRQFADLFTVQFLSSLMGQFGATSIHVEFPNPLDSELVVYRQTTRGQEIWKQCVDIIKQHMTEDVDYDKLPPFVGTGLYRVVACTNHSCIPSAEFHFTNGALVSLRTLQAVEQDEELFITYIDSQLPLKQRLKRLHDTWGFVCKCLKCQHDMLRQCVDEAKNGKSAPETADDSEEDEANSEEAEQNSEEGMENDEETESDAESEEIVIGWKLSAAVETMKQNMHEWKNIEI